MCLPIKVARPDNVLAEGTHMGHEWAVTHNTNGYRCGYVKVEPGHPWHGKTDSDLYESGAYPKVHGGITFAEADTPCDKGGPDNGWWLGFDCAHHGDAQDTTLPLEHKMPAFLGGIVRTQEYVESECRSLCEQAAEAGRSK